MVVLEKNSGVLIAVGNSSRVNNLIKAMEEVKNNKWPVILEMIVDNAKMVEGIVMSPLLRKEIVELNSLVMPVLASSAFDNERSFFQGGTLLRIIKNKRVIDDGSKARARIGSRITGRNATIKKKGRSSVDKETIKKKY